jgi:hypothetical protein
LFTVAAHRTGFRTHRRPGVLGAIRIRDLARHLPAKSIVRSGIEPSVVA